MGWQERDWARVDRAATSVDWLRIAAWSVVGALALAVAVVLVSRPGRQRTPAPPPVVYAGATADQGRLACTAEGRNVRLNAWICTEWTVVRPGQATAPALDPGGACGARHVDQRTRRWVCDRISPPDQGSLPPPAPGEPPATSLA